MRPRFALRSIFVTIRIVQFSRVAFERRPRDEPIKLSERGWLWCEQMGFWLGTWKRANIASILTPG